MKTETAITSEQAASQLEFIFATAIAKGYPRSVRADRGEVLTPMDLNDCHRLECFKIAVRRAVAFFHPLFLLLLAIPRVCDWGYSLWLVRKGLWAHEYASISKVMLGDTKDFLVPQSWLTIRVWQFGLWCNKSEILAARKKEDHNYNLARQTVRRYNAGAQLLVPKLVELGVPVTGDILFMAAELALVERARKVLDAKKLHSKMPQYLKTIEDPLIVEMDDVIAFCFVCGIKLQEDQEGGGGRKLEGGNPSIRNHYFKQAASLATAE